MKALIDLGERFVSLESTGDNNPKIPLLVLAYHHSKNYGNNCQISDKIALLLSRGANAKARNPRGETCLHLVFSNHGHHGDFCFCNDESRLWPHLSQTTDIVILMISAGADVCAVDEQGRSVSDAAIQSGQQILWTEALKYCGIDMRDVLTQPNVNPAYSTALSSQCSRTSRSVASQISLADYLKRRKGGNEGEWRNETGYDDFSSSEDDESENEDLAVELNKPMEAKQTEFLEKHEETHTRYIDNVARQKAKLE